MKKPGIKRMFGSHPSSGNLVKRPKKVLRGLVIWLLVPLLFSGSLSPNFISGAESSFQVEMVSPQRFRIQPLISGPVSSAIVGGGGNQTLITRQENGYTVIDAEVPVGAVLHLKVGSRSLRLQMVDSEHYQCWKD
jgi:hypothetical protein